MQIKDTYIVMPGIEWQSGKANKSIFPFNRVDIPTESEAQQIADQRTREDHEAGNTNIQWFHMKAF